MELRKASVVCPVRVRPLKSVIVPDNMTGRLIFCSAKYSAMAKSAALQFSVSNTVSTKRRSIPPSISLSICSR
jgi:hypothetical protein